MMRKIYDAAYVKERLQQLSYEMGTPEGEAEIVIVRESPESENIVFFGLAPVHYIDAIDPFDVLRVMVPKDREEHIIDFSEFDIDIDDDDDEPQVMLDEDLADYLDVLFMEAARLFGKDHIEEACKAYAEAAKYVRSTEAVVIKLGDSEYIEVEI